jgi:hypothetical protein
VGALVAGGRAVERASTPPAPRQLRGAYHVHSTASDGSGTLEEIAQAAASAGLDFVVLTDHNPTAQPPPERRHGVWLIHGAELSTPAGHLVALGLSEAVADAHRAQALREVHRQGGFAALAHPIQWKGPWTDWERAEEADGFELYSADSFLRHATVRPFTRLLPAVGAYAVDPGHALSMLVDDPARERARLFELIRRRRAAKVTLCAVDAHGLPPYGLVFERLAMVLPPEVPSSFETPAAAARAIVGALRRGEAVCVFREHGEADGFGIEGLAPGRVAAVGQELLVRVPGGLKAGTALKVFGPARHLGDGRVRVDGEGPVAVELWREGPGRLFGARAHPWIIASPISAESAVKASP